MTVCKYCNKRIVKVNFVLGERWVHQSSESSFQDGIHEFCYISVATPDLKADKDKAEGFFDRVHEVDALVQKANEKEN